MRRVASDGAAPLVHNGYKVSLVRNLVKRVILDHKKSFTTWGRVLVNELENVKSHCDAIEECYEFMLSLRPKALPTTVKANTAANSTSCLPRPSIP